MSLQVGKFFVPNARLDKNAVKMMLGFQIIGLIAFWFFSPFVFLPTPGEVLSSIGELWGQGLATELITSFTLNLEAIAIATILSLILAWSSTLGFFRPWIEFLGKLRFLSMIGLTFFFTLMTANGHELKLSMLVFSISVFFVTGAADVIRCIPKEQYDLAKVLHMGPWKTVYEVVILGQTDKMFDVLRQNVAIGWMMLSFVEGMSRSEGGIGAMLMTENKYFHLSEILAIQLVILGLGLIQDYALGGLKRMVCPYAFLTLEAR